MNARQKVLSAGSKAELPRCCLGLTLVMASILPAQALGQGKLPGGGFKDSIPRTEYYVAFRHYNDGQFLEALKAFEDAERGGTRGANGRWVDSIPLHTMVGECHYQLGNHKEALLAYRAAIRQYLRFPQFLFQVNWDPKVVGPRPARVEPRINWGPVKRTGKPASYSTDIPLMIGGVIQLPGVTIDGRKITHVHVFEMVRTLAVATRRYGELLGPAAKHDATLNELLEQLDKRPVPALPLPQALGDLLLGVASRAAGRVGDAPGLLRRGLVAGEAEHPLTSLGLLELGHLLLLDAKFKEAAEFFEKATYAAVQYKDTDAPGWTGVCDALEEAFRYGFIAHRLSNARRPFSKSELAASWSRQARWNFLTTSLLLNTAESAASLRNTAAAAKALQAAKSLMNGQRAEMPRAKIGARMNQLEALVLYQQNKVSEGDAAFARAIEFQKRGSLWLFHIGLVDAINANPPVGVSERDRAALFDAVLRDPGRYDWQVQPLEAISVLVGPRQAPLEHWFELAMSSDRGGGIRAMEIADLARRHRFHSSLEDGGRLLSLRWLLEAPLEQLDAEAVRDRRDLLVAFKDYRQLSQQAANLRAELQRLPLAIDRAADAAAFESQRKKLAELARVSQQQETILRQIAVDRIHAPLVFPPLRKVKDIQEGLPAAHAALVFFSTSASSKRLYGFIVTKEKDKYPAWRVRDPSVLTAAMQRLLREMGHFGENRVVPAGELAKSDWKQQAQGVMDQLFTSTLEKKETLPPGLEELVIVPDSVLWYLPFEALPLPAAGTEPLIRRMRVRYAPTMSLALPDGRGRKSDSNAAVVLGNLMAGKADAERVKAAFDDLRRVVPNAVALPDLLPATPAIYSTLFDQLIVLDNLKLAAGPYSLRPLQAQTGPGGTLDSWLPLPWGGPDHVILPGFHTAAEHSLNEKFPHSNGSDVFLSVCGLMATGSRTVLISRWRTGGKTSFDLVREFAQELPQSTAARAWQRSVFLCTDSPWQPDSEPRVAIGPKDVPGAASHPFFWSGYILVDTGTVPPRATVRDEPKERAGQ